MAEIQKIIIGHLYSMTLISGQRAASNKMCQKMHQIIKSRYEWALADFEDYYKNEFIQFSPFLMFCSHFIFSGFKISECPEEYKHLFVECDTPVVDLMVLE